jgi:hypothetical protein
MLMFKNARLVDGHAKASKPGMHVLVEGARVPASHTLEQVFFAKFGLAHFGIKSSLDNDARIPCQS